MHRQLLPPLVLILQRQPAEVLTHAVRRLFRNVSAPERLLWHVLATPQPLFIEQSRALDKARALKSFPRTEAKRTPPKPQRKNENA